MAVQGSITHVVEGPAPGVFALITDIDRLPEWNTIITQVVERPATLAPDVEWVVEIKAMGRSWPSRSRVLVYQYMTKAIEDSHWLGNRIGVGTVIGRVGDLLDESDPEATAVLEGAGDALAPGYGHAPHTVERRRQAVATSEALLGATRRRELYNEGMAMTDDEAVAYAKAAIARRLEDHLSSATNGSDS